MSASPDTVTRVVTGAFGQSEVLVGRKVGKGPAARKRRRQREAAERAVVALWERGDILAERGTLPSAREVFAARKAEELDLPNGHAPAETLSPFVARRLRAA